MKITNIVLVLVLLLSGLNKEVFAMYQEQSSTNGVVKAKTRLLQTPSRQTRLNEPIGEITSACADYVEGEIIVKMKPAAAQASSSMATKLLTTSLSLGTAVNSEDSAEVESYLEQNIPGLGDISLDKAIKSSNALSGVPLANFTASTNARVVQTTPKTKLQIKAESLQQKYGFNRTYKINTAEQDCTRLERLIKQIDANSNVEYAEANRKVKINAVANDPLYLSHGEVWGLPYDELWGLKQIKADQAWDLSTGKGVVVAVIDTGVDYNHPDLWDNIWVDPNLVTDRNKDGKINLNDADLNRDKTISENEITPGMFGYDFAYNDSDPQDVHGHGTHVAGTIAAVRNNAKGIVGVAPDAKILILRGLDDRGSGSYDRLASAVKYAADLLANNSHINSLVTNNSWGGEDYSQTLADAFDYAKELGLINIAAAGNSSADAKDFSPASLPSVITVAASRVDSGLAEFSNFGLSVDVAAPGGGDTPDPNQNNILSTMNVNARILAASESKSSDLIVHSDKDRPEYAYVRIAGTSMASPHIAGVVALIKSLHPDYNLEDIRAILRSKVSPINSDKIETGITNAFDAVKLTEVPPKAFLYSLPGKALKGYISLKGTASSKNFLNYTLEYSTDMDTINPTWVPIGTFYKAIEDGLILDNFDSSRLPDGKLVVRLRVQDRNGEESQDLIDINFDNVRLISPRTEDDLEIIDDPIYHLGMVLLTNYQTSTLGNMLMPVVVDIFGQTSSFVINVIDASTGNAITETGLLSYIRDKSTLGRVDTSKLPHPGLYKLQIIKNNSIAATTDFIYEPRLVKPEPLRILEDPWQLLSGHFKVIDFNNDGVDEILLGEGKIRVLSNSNIILEHSFSDGFESFASPLAADLDGDGNKELISPLYGYNGSKFIHKISVVNKDGKELPQWEQHPGDYSFETMIGDVNFDGKSDIISVSALYTSVDTNSISIYLTSSFLGSDNAVHQESHLLASNIYVMDVIIGDFDGNGKEEIALLVSDMDDGKEAIMIFSLNGDLIKTISIRVGRNLLGLIAADVDQDHDLEFIVGGYSINSSGFYSSEDSTFMINVLNHDGSVLPGWPFTTEIGNWWNMSQLAIGDLNNDGFPEIVFGANQVSYVAPEDYHNDYLFALNRDGQLLPNYPVTRGISFNRLLTIMFPLLGTPPSSIAIADVDNDGKCDIITAMEPDKNTRAVIFAYKDDGTLVKGFPLHAGNTAPRTFAQTPNAMAVGNFDKDPGLELVFADTLKYVYIYNLDTPATAKVEWGMYRSDVENTGVYYKKGKPRPKADLGVQILADKSSVTTGDIFTLGLQVRNNLNLTKGWTGTAYGVMTSMDIPVGLTPVNIDGRCSIKDNKLVCNFETMLPGMMKNLYAQFKATNSQLKDMEVSIGGASVTATSKLLSQISVDPNISNNISNMVKVLVKQKRADLSITTFTTNKASYLKGEDVILTVAAANNIGLGFGVVNNTAYGVVLKIPQPEFLVFDPSKQDPNQNCALVNKEIVCQLGNMPVLLGTVKRTIKFSIPANSTVGTRDLSIGTATVVATSTLADQITIDPNSNNNTKYTSISIVQYADLVADIKASNSSYRYNENIPLILSVQNKQDVAKSYISDAYNVITRMVVPPSYDYIGDNPDCAMDSTRVLTCNFSTLKSNASTTRVVTLKPLILRAGLKVLNFSLNTSSQATVPTQKTIDPLVLNNSKNLVLTAQ